MRPSKLDDASIVKWLAAHPGWEKVRAGDQDGLGRAYKLEDFSQALAMVVRVGLAAEKRDHHPDVELGWGRVRVVWTTHDQKGITSLDTELAEATDRLR